MGGDVVTEREMILGLVSQGISSLDIHRLRDLFPLREQREKFLEEIKKRIRSEKKRRVFESDLVFYAERLQETCQHSNIQILVDVDEEYPKMLRDMECPPCVLFVRGDLEKVLSIPRLAIVGSRKCTTYGKVVCEELARALAERQVASVSGLALGIDGLAHRGSLKTNMPTLAVLGSGIDVIYPANHHLLYEEILSHGAIVSEYPPGMRPTKYTFPERNRIICALSQACLVVEAQEKSGSLITARLAAEMGRDVFAVPGNINSPYSRGTNRLIRDGALPYTCPEDLDFLFPIPKKEKKELESALSPVQRRILDCVIRGVSTIDEICRALSMDVATVTMECTLLEMEGLLLEGEAGRFVCTAQLS